MPKVIEISNGGTTARINTENMQLFSLVRKGIDVMWSGGAPENLKPSQGWQNSEIIMFPIVGDSINGHVVIGNKQYPMAKHGISRDLEWQVEYEENDRVAMVQVYEGGTQVKSKKNEISVFPNSYVMQKEYSITATGKLIFRVAVDNKSNETLPYAIGWHPAFVTPLETSAAIEILTYIKEPESIGLDKIQKSDGNVMLFEKVFNVIYKHPNFSVILSHGFKWGTQLWNRGEGCIAIEPISTTSLHRRDCNEPEDLLSGKHCHKLRRGERMSAFTNIDIEL